jgi:nucleotide-binding universal stress UspA family protein
MNTILVPTDFSVHAENAAHYAFKLAACINARLILCNAFNVPAQEIMAAQVAWPLEDYESMQESSTAGLKLLADRLKEHDMEKDCMAPEVSYSSSAGSVADVVGSLAVKERALLVIMGTSENGGLVRFLWGLKRNSLIEEVRVPILLVPERYQYKRLKRIAFATDWQPTDIDVIQSLTTLARYDNAAILIVHISKSEDTEWLKDNSTSEFLREVTGKLNYPNIYYRQIKNDDINKGLEWLEQNGDIDMLAMVHRRHPILEKLIKGSHTKTVAEHNLIPLLIFPAEALPNGSKHF